VLYLRFAKSRSAELTPKPAHPTLLRTTQEQWHRAVTFETARTTIRCRENRWSIRLPNPPWPDTEFFLVFHSFLEVLDLHPTDPGDILPPKIELQGPDDVVGHIDFIGNSSERVLGALFSTTTVPKSS
jgi:hypothetical protein